MKNLSFVALGAGVLLASAPTVALAQTDRERTFESPQHFAAELRVGLYYPKIDDEFGGAATPFENAFGDNPRLEIGGELDWQVYRIPYVGTIGPGLSVNYLKFGRPALLLNGEPSEEQTTLQIYPMYAVAVLRVDVLAREMGIPIVPYAKGGLGFAAWRMTNGSGTAKTFGADGTTVTATAKGVSYGPQFALGGMFLLDFLDEYAARQADQSIGVNNTYVFAEYVSSHLGNVNGTGLQVGANQIAFGLAFEF
jgi:hypothetical protein